MKIKVMGIVLIFLCVSGPYAFAADSMTKRISEGSFFDGDNLDGNSNNFFGANQGFFNASDSSAEMMKCGSGETLAYYTCTCGSAQLIAQACSEATAKNQAAASHLCSKSDVKCAYCGTDSCDT